MEPLLEDGTQTVFSVPFSISQTSALLLVFAIIVFMSYVKNSTVNSLQFLKFTNVLINLTKYKGLEFLKAILKIPTFAFYIKE